MNKDKKPTPSEPNNQLKPGSQQRLWLWLPILLFWIWAWQGLFEMASFQTIPYSDFKRHVLAKQVQEVVVNETEINGFLKAGVPLPSSPLPSSATTGKPWYAPLLPPQLQPSAPNAVGSQTAETDIQPTPFRTVRVEDPQLIKDLTDAGTQFAGRRPSLISQILWSWILPFFLIFLLWSWLARRFSAGLGSASLGIGKSRAKLLVDQKTGVTFNDVAGCDEAKHELEEIVDFLKNPDVYKRLGATIPKGVLLVGPPGTGKTLLARAVAGEAHVPFFSIAGSDFVEMFVGVGAARVRDLFAEAKKQAPCIIFIDEIDTIGRQRSVQMAVANDEREQTLNQLLSEMDGFEGNTDLIILAATNRPEVLDPALLRPGRFDRQVVIDAPDRLGRQAIFRVHTRGKPLAADVAFDQLAAATPGLAGADLANIVNEAALLATRRKKSAISQIDFTDAIEKIVAGPERKSRRLGDEERRRVAYHETGHALVAAFCKHADPIRKISIVPRGKAALGYTLQTPEDEKYMFTREALLDKIRGLLGGRAAEELIFLETSTGAENDLDKATSIAQQMICFYGMGSLGLAHYGERRPLYLASEGIARNCSPETGRRIDEEVEDILRHAYEDALRILRQQRTALDLIAVELLNREVIEAPDFNKILGRVAHRSAAAPVLAPARSMPFANADLPS